MSGRDKSLILVQFEKYIRDSKLYLGNTINTVLKKGEGIIPI